LVPHISHIYQNHLMKKTNAIQADGTPSPANLREKSMPRSTWPLPTLNDA
jgi:hypothetical protein